MLLSWIFILKGMTGASAPFSYLVFNICNWVGHRDNCITIEIEQASALTWA
jgi:hypothetical protein